MKLALGTVQFGLPYGAFNAGRRMEVECAGAVLRVALENGIDTLDTARGYGTSEEVLGRLGAARQFRIITKIGALAPDAGSGQVRASVESSLAALGAEQVGAVLFHAADDLLGTQGDQHWRALESCVADGLVGGAGASVYDPVEAEALLDRYPLAFLQFPFNVFDRRFETSGLLARAKAKGVELHARSALLQGFAVADPATLPPSLSAHRSVLERFAEASRAQEIERLTAAIGFVVGQPQIDRVVVGVDSPDQLQQLCDIARTPVDGVEFAGCVSNDLTLIDPRRWARA